MYRERLPAQKPCSEAVQRNASDMQRGGGYGMRPAAGNRAKHSSSSAVAALADLLRITVALCGGFHATCVQLRAGRRVALAVPLDVQQ